MWKMITLICEPKELKWKGNNMNKPKHCCYCFAKLDDYGGYPSDYGLHSMYIDYSDKSVCPKCNELITLTNRYLAEIVLGKPHALQHLQRHINSLNQNDFVYPSVDIREQRRCECIRDGIFTVDEFVDLKD